MARTCFPAGCGRRAFPTALLMLGALLLAASGCKPREPVASPATATPSAKASAAPTPAASGTVGQLQSLGYLAASPTPAASPTAAAGAEPAPTGGPTESAGKRVPYAEGITIDYSVPQVEIEAKVVLQDGPLELLLCAHNTKEHESILTTPARPLKIYEALGLIGLTPGRPPQFDPQTSQALPAEGQPVAIAVRVGDAASHQAAAAYEWLRSTATKNPIEPVRWLFMGSRREGDTFMADEDGAIVCVVDFDSALVGVAEAHSADNTQLWVEANPQVVPAVGTTCTVIIRPIEDEPIVVQLTPEGVFVMGEEIIDAMQLDELIRRRVRDNPAQKLELSSIPGTPSVMVKFAGKAIIGTGIKSENLTMILPPEDEAAAPTAPVAPASSTPPPANPQGGTRGIPPHEPTGTAPTPSPSPESAATAPADASPSPSPSTTPAP